MKKSNVDFFSDTTIRVWYRLHANGGDDLSAERLNYCCIDGEDEPQDTCAVGTPPTWWDNDIDLVTGLFQGHYEKVGDLEFRTNWLYWALENGVAPGQPFLLAIDNPRGYRSYEGDYEEEWDYWLIEVRKWPARYVSKQWARYFRKRDAYRALDARNSEEYLQLAERDVAAMSVMTYMYQADSYSNGGWRHQARLISGRRYSMQYTLGFVAAREFIGEGASKEEALAHLISKACAFNPRLSPELIRMLPVRRS